MKAIALISGGLDSILAAKVIEAQAIEVIGLRFKIPFCLKRSRNYPDWGIETKSAEINDDFLAMIKNPRYGYGANMNPCIDCKILMLRKSRQLLDEFGAKFIITGEVLGQRPMSQHKQALLSIAKRAGLEGLVLRPLSAQLLPETVPEKEGWVKRESLLSFSGRGRSQQMNLAKNLGIKEYAQPAGGCLLTDIQFSKRLKDLIKFGTYNLENVLLLKIGRHFRLSDAAKLVVGRNETENNELESLARDGDLLFLPPIDMAGPTALGRGKFSEEEIQFSAAITARYCDLAGCPTIAITQKIFPGPGERIITLAPAPCEEAVKYRL